MSAAQEFSQLARKSVGEKRNTSFFLGSPLCPPLGSPPASSTGLERRVVRGSMADLLRGRFISSWFHEKSLCTQSPAGDSVRWEAESLHCASPPLLPAPLRCARREDKRECLFDYFLRLFADCKQRKSPVPRIFSTHGPPAARRNNAITRRGPLRGGRHLGHRWSTPFRDLLRSPDTLIAFALCVTVLF